MKADWLRKKVHIEELQVNNMINNLELNTVCLSAHCPNRWECYKNKVATFMILGDRCSRRCRFCAIEHGRGQEVDNREVEGIVEASMKLDLDYLVVTSVTRDDLLDGGASQFVNVIKQVKGVKKNIEVLIPDFDGNIEAIDSIIDSQPEVINHNIETVPSLYNKVRIGACYERSLALLERVKMRNPSIITKTGLMLGLGEEEEELKEVFEEIGKRGVDILTLGQYLQPSNNHIDVKDYYTQEQFDRLAILARDAGIRWVEAGPFVRSSYNASHIYKEVKEARY